MPKSIPFNLYRDARWTLGLSQSKLAKLLSMHPMTISRYERGVSEPPTAYKILCKLILASGKQKALDLIYLGTDGLNSV